MALLRRPLNGVFAVFGLNALLNVDFCGFGLKAFSNGRFCGSDETWPISHLFISGPIGINRADFSFFHEREFNQDVGVPF